jgi:hypothetical protein
MSKYSVEKLPDEPIIIAVAFEEFDWKHDLPDSSLEVKQLLDEQPLKVFYIADFQQTHMGLNDLIFAANFSARSGTNVLHHPKIYKFLAVTTNRAIALANQGLSSEVFGAVPVKVFPSIDEALIYAREHITEVLEN